MNYQNFKQMVVDKDWSMDDIKSYYDNWLNNWISSNYSDYDSQEKMLNAERYIEEND